MLRRVYILYVYIYIYTCSVLVRSIWFVVLIIEVCTILGLRPPWLLQWKIFKFVGCQQRGGVNTGQLNPMYMKNQIKLTHSGKNKMWYRYQRSQGNRFNGFTHIYRVVVCLFFLLLYSEPDPAYGGHFGNVLEHSHTWQVAVIIC